MNDKVPLLTPEMARACYGDGLDEWDDALLAIAEGRAIVIPNCTDLLELARWHEQQAAVCWKLIGGAR